MSQKDEREPNLKGGSVVPFLKKFPIVIAGTAMTVGALIYGLRAMLQGDKIKAGQGMGMRVAFQATTLGVLFTAMAFAGSGPITDFVQIYRKRHPTEPKD